MITAPDFVLNAAKDALNRVECNQYSPTKVPLSTRFRNCNLILTKDCSLGASKIKEGNRRRIPTILRLPPRPRQERHHHDRRKRRHALSLYGLHRTRRRSNRLRTLLRPVHIQHRNARRQRRLRPSPPSKGRRQENHLRRRLDTRHERTGSRPHRAG